MTDLAAHELTGRLATVLPEEPGRRLLHSRGSTAVGVFYAEPAAATLSSATLFAGEPVSVTARFSGARGGAAGHDADTGDQGLAVRFTPPSGAPADLIAFTLPVFFVRTGKDMLEFLTAAAPDPETGRPDPDRLAQFQQHHPEAAAALAAGTDRAPSSYLGQRYHSVHAYGLVDAEGRTSWARLQWHPEPALPALVAADAGELPPDYLSADLIHRLPARLTLHARLPAADDPVHDPTALWADPPRLIQLGSLRLDRAVPEGDLDFDPLRVPAGMAPPRDRLAADRSAVYRAARHRRRDTHRLS